MSDFQERMGLAAPWEGALIAALRAWDWTACPYGQGMLSADVRDALRVIATPIRWHPDIIAVRGDVACFVDAKAGTQETPNHSIEQSSLAAFNDWYLHARLPVVVCWEVIRANGRRSADCAFTWDLLADGAPLRKMPYRGDGSGTSGYLWPKRRCRRFGDVFGPGAPSFGPQPDWRMDQIRRAIGAAA